MNLHLDKRALDIAEKVVGDDDELLTSDQTAALLSVSIQWLTIGRTRGYGPPFIRLGTRKVRYRRDALRRWLSERAEYRSTREYGEERGVA